MICIAKYESSFNCKATNKNVDGSTDYGLFEINSYYWCSGDASSKYNECGTSCQTLMDCQKNANCAYRVYKEQGYNAWYGYQYHKSECDSYPAPICLEGEDIYEPVSNVDLTQYSGRWYQVYKDVFDMTFQGQGECAVADYTLANGKIEVLNSQINKNGKVSQINGFAFYEGNNSGGELSVSLDGVPKTSPYWIIELGPIVNDQYEYSIVSDPNRISLFVLTRDVDLFYTKYDSKVRDLLNELGFNNKINEPTTMIQENCDYTLYTLDVDIYTKPKIVNNLKGPSCGTCGTGYQTCCIGFAVDGYPCDCHLTGGGSGVSGSNCGDCGTAFAACCIGYAADGYPCECDVM
jgi:lipocalin